MVYVFTADTLPVEQLLRQYSRPVQQQGEALYKQGRATVEQSQATSAQVSVEDPPRPSQQVKIFLSGSYVNLTCSCRESFGWGACRHKVAALLALRDYLQAHPPRIWQAILDRAIQSPSKRSTPAPSANVILFSLQERGNSWSVSPLTLNGRHLPAGHGGDPDAVASAIEQGGLQGQAKPIRSQITPDSYPLMPTSVVAAVNSIIGAGGGYGYWYGNARLLGAVLGMIAGALVYTGDDLHPLSGGRVFVHDEPATVALDLARDGADLTASFSVTLDGRHVVVKPGGALLVSREPTWMLVDDQLFRIAESGISPDIVVSYPRVRIPAADEADFLDRYLVPLSAQVAVRGNAVEWDNLQEPPEPRLYLSEREGELLAELRFGYGPFELPYEKSLPAATVRRVAGKAAMVRITRGPDAEQAAWQELGAGYGLKRGTSPDEFLLRKNVPPADFLLREIPKLAAAGYTIFGEEALTLARVNRAKPTISFRVSSEIDWFDVQAVVQFGDQMLPLKDLKRALKRRDRYVKLADGSLGAIPEEWAERYRHLFAFAEETDDGLRLSGHHLALLDDALSEADRAATDAAFAERRERLRGFERIEPTPLPQGFTGTLRDYQKAGYDWLHFLRGYGFGGCLADDMGLGKTIQALAFLQSLRERDPASAASLIVMPRSLLFNWQREAAQFTPGLRVYIHADQGRAGEATAFDQHDLVLTTYGVMLRDIELLRQYRFHTVILDESQAIKNPLAETSRAARLLQAEQRIALTGTPVENTTMELWSQFAFLNPGLLGNLDYFRNEFATPIERRQDEGTSQFLRKMVFPFILRRTKEQVATDLPPRSEELLITEMEPAQRKLYVKTRDYYRAMLLGMIDDDGMDDARMKILEGLLRLRQICNHPQLVDAKARAGSGKFELLMETLQTLRSEGHKALIFSQFVQMLSIIRTSLDELGIPYAYLDGSTRNRQAEVDRFQSTPELPFFLISLKAGGVGLNLTAADYVIHVDPWWNPAVEMQATDRTHRIGQTKPVFVYKLITRDTVEEKILQLQDQKRALVAQLISAEGGVFKSLTRDDVEVLFT
jgi:non-specific serine/threonine protein kinase